MSKWTVKFTTKARKQWQKLDRDVQSVLRLFVEDQSTQGPAPGKSWPNYGKLRPKKSIDTRHCHLIKGNPAYVCCWEIIDKTIKVIEVYYVGTHEKAPY